MKSDRIIHIYYLLIDFRLILWTIYRGLLLISPLYKNSTRLTHKLSCLEYSPNLISQTKQIETVDDDKTPCTPYKTLDAVIISDAWCESIYPKNWRGCRVGQPHYTDPQHEKKRKTLFAPLLAPLAKTLSNRYLFLRSPSSPRFSGSQYNFASLARARPVLLTSRADISSKKE